MKGIFLLAIIFFGFGLFHVKLEAQANNANIWIFGYPPNKPEKYFGGVMLDFNQNIASPEYFNIYYDASEPAVLSSNTGRLLTYSNGCVVINSEHQVMKGGDSISYGEIWDNHCMYGYPGTQNSLLLPWPADSSKAILFHVKSADDISTNFLLYSIIEFNIANPLGIVTEKNKLLLNPGTSTLITATRHANGRDWWIIFPEYQTNRFFSILMAPQGVSIIDTQSIGSPWGDRAWASQAVFSPDGTKYIRFNPWKGLDVFDFDRCKGQLLNAMESGPFSDPVEVGGGVAVSSDSRYLYVSNNIKLFQFDLFADDILSSKVLIDVYDGYQNPFSTTFYQMMLAPDGKIYMFATNGVKSIHVIHHPELKGTACEFVQHGMELPANIGFGSINVPYFKLGTDDGSSCDTLGINNLPIADFRYEIDSMNLLLVRFRNLSYFEPTTFYWNFGNSEVSVLKDPMPFEYTAYGAYNVCLTVSNEYGNNTFCRIVNLQDSITSNEHALFNELFKVVPNPFNSELSIMSENNFSTISFELYSILGKRMLTSRLTNKINNVNVQQLPNGLYFYNITQDGDIIQTGKLIKQ